jgi:hypothetical protein
MDILPHLCVISLNGGWTTDPERNKPGRDLGYTRYNKKTRRWAATPNKSKSPRRSARPYSGLGARVEEGMVGFVNVKTGYRARLTTVRFSSRET